MTDKEMQQILLQLMQQYAESSAKWVAQQNAMDKAFMDGDFRSWLRDEIEGAQDNDQREDGS